MVAGISGIEELVRIVGLWRGPCFCLLFVCLRKLSGVLGVLEMYSIIRFFLVFFILNLSVNVFANQPVVRFRNETVGILAEGGADVFIASENVIIMGDLELKTMNNETVNITEKVDVLASLQNDMGLRVLHLAQRKGMGVVCNPKGTEYRERDFETGEFGACVCKKGYTGISCEPGYIYTFEISVLESGNHLEITKIEFDNKAPNSDNVSILLQENWIRTNGSCTGEQFGCCGDNCNIGSNITVMLDDIDMSYYQWKKYQKSVGTQIFDVVSDVEVSEISISYWRPKYAPGWRILKNGEEILRETTNRGSDSWPAPVTYIYLLSD